MHEWHESTGAHGQTFHAHVGPYHCETWEYKGTWLWNCAGNGRFFGGNEESLELAKAAAEKRSGVK